MVETLAQKAPVTPSKSKSPTRLASKPSGLTAMTSLKKSKVSPVRGPSGYTSPYSIRSIKQSNLAMASQEMIILSHRSQGSHQRDSIGSRGSSAGTRSDHLSFGN